jgi:hypothetical protein
MMNLPGKERIWSLIFIISVCGLVKNAFVDREIAQALNRVRKNSNKRGCQARMAGAKALIYSAGLIGPAKAVPLLQSSSLRVFRRL